ncbi:hypothetical protein [Microbacterium sp. NPDC091676]|uniref:hypothetical protein n=1 Tax=Microbacterium sp. NPDC091676 TaxID=3364212 RepID=UPI003807281F
MPLPEQFEYPTELVDLQFLFEELTQIRSEVANRIAAMSQGSASPRNVDMYAAVTVGTAGILKPETPGVGHLLATHPTRAELESLLEYTMSTNQQMMAARGEINATQDDHDVIHEHEVAFALARNESSIRRAIEILDELSEHFPS